MKMLDASGCADVRADMAGLQVGEHLYRSTNTLQYGAPEVIQGTGRATCRCCGQRIAAGAESLRFAWDFNGSGSWTAQEIQIHRVCPTPQLATAS